VSDFYPTRSPVPPSVPVDVAEVGRSHGDLDLLRRSSVVDREASGLPSLFARVASALLLVRVLDARRREESPSAPFAQSAFSGCGAGVQQRPEGLAALQGVGVDNPRLGVLNVRQDDPRQGDRFAVWLEIRARDVGEDVSSVADVRVCWSPASDDTT
jgi:hypothetical protein